MNLEVPPELEAELTRLAADTGRTVDQVAIDLLANSFDHDEWFRREVEKGCASAREAAYLTTTKWRPASIGAMAADACPLDGRCGWPYNRPIRIGP